MAQPHAYLALGALAMYQVLKHAIVKKHAIQLCAKIMPHSSSATVEQSNDRHVQPGQTIALAQPLCRHFLHLRIHAIRHGIESCIHAMSVKACHGTASASQQTQVGLPQPNPHVAEAGVAVPRLSNAT